MEQPKLYRIRSQSGAALIEYPIIATAIGVVVFFVMLSTSSKMSDVFNAAGNQSVLAPSIVTGGGAGGGDGSGGGGGGVGGGVGGGGAGGGGGDPGGGGGGDDITDGNPDGFIVPLHGR